MSRTRRDPTKIPKWIEIDREDALWLEQTYPGLSYSALFTMLLKKFREVHTVKLDDYAELGARELKKLLEES